GKGRGRGRQGRERQERPESQGEAGQGMSDQPPKISRVEAYEHWTARHAKSVLFVILTLVGAGVYFAYNLPVAVFPNTDFPRIVVGADNGVMPIEQMTVIVTRQLEEAVNGIQGINRVQS